MLIPLEWGVFGGASMSLELFAKKVDDLLSSGILDAELDAGMLLRLEVSRDGVRMEGLRSKEFCPDDTNC